MAVKTAATQTAAQSRIHYMAKVGMLGALATVLMVVEFPLPFLAPPFYKLDFSEVPVLIGGFAMGPAAAALIEFIKVLLHMLIKGSSTAGVGDFANFLIGCSMAIPAAFIYRRHKTKNTAIVGMTVGTVCMMIIGGFLNAYVLLPAYSAALIPMETILEMGKAVNSSIDSVSSFVIIAVTPFNLVKGIVVSLITMLLYKHISKILKNL